MPEVIVPDIQSIQQGVVAMSLANGGNQPTTLQSLQAKIAGAKGTSIDILPAEVMVQIVLLAKFEESPYWGKNEDYPFLKTMRLVSPAFNKVASQYLFNTVDLYEHPSRYHGLDQISKTPYLAPLVEYVRIANLGFLPDCKYEDRGWDTQDRGTHDCRTSAECGSYEFWLSCAKRPRAPYLTIGHHPPNGGPLAALDFSEEATYKRYVAWRDGEREMKQHVRNGTAPFVNMALLPNFKKVEAIGLKEMRVVRRKHQLKRFSETRRFYETGLIEANAMNGIRYATLTHIPTFLISASACRNDITALYVHRVDELFKGGEHNHANPHIQLRSLRNLVIDLTQVWYSYKDLTNPNRLAPWLRNIDMLEELHLHQNPLDSSDQGDVILLLRDLHFPNLQTIESTDGVIDPDALRRFLTTHKKTLRSIKIWDPFMDEGEWARIRAEFGPGSAFAQGKKVRFSEPRQMEDDENQDGDGGGRQEDGVVW